MSNFFKLVSSISCVIAVVVSLAEPLISSAATRANSPQQPTEFSSLIAQGSSRGVLIQWQRPMSDDNVGFNVYRIRNSRRVKVNNELILGTVFAPRRPDNFRSNQSFSFLDKGGSLDSSYIIESVSVDGGATESREVKVSGKEHTGRYEELVTSEALRRSEFAYPSAASPSVETNGSLEDQWFIASQPGVKISIKTDGWYKVTHQQVVAAGFNPNVDIRNLQLFVDGRELAILTSKHSGAFSSGDSIEFFGRGLDLQTTDTRIYYLIAGTGPGKRVQGDLRVSAALPERSVTRITPAVVDRTPVWFGFVLEFLNGLNVTKESPSIAKKTKTKALNESRTTTTKVEEPLETAPVVTSKRKPRKKARAKKPKLERSHSATTTPGSFAFTVERKDRINYFSTVQNGDTENYFGAVVSGTPVTQNLTVSNLDSAATGPARIEVAMQGVGTVAHQIEVSVNNVAVGTLSFFALQSSRQVFEVPISVLTNGANAVKFTSQIGGVTLIDYVRLTYPHTFKADNNALRLSLRPNHAVTIDGFTSSNIRVIDVTDPFAVTISRPVVQASGGGFAIDIPSVTGKGKSRILHALPDTEAQTPAAVSLQAASTLNSSSNAADLLIIAHKSLISTAAPLVTLRQSQGLAVMVVDIEDVYDEFDYGVHGPKAIKAFLARASAVWSIKPRYVILLGDASFDSRNYENFGDLDLVPTKLIDATFNETASDDWLSDFNGDGLPEIAMGRLPAGTVGEANLIVSKIVNFAPGNVPQSALLVADNPTGYYFNFEHANDDVQALLPPTIAVQKVYRRLTASDAVARANVNSHFNAGQVLVNYTGHGNVDTWTSAPIFNTGDATAVTNGNKLPFVVVMDCLNGYFQAPNIMGIAEGLMKAPNGGSVAGFASSGLTVPDGQHAMANQLYSLIFSGQPIALGDAIKSSKAATTDLDVRNTWIFFGDPSMRLR